MTTSIREEMIREIAYQLWMDEGKPAGKDVEHYHKAEQIFEESRKEQAGPISSGTAIPSDESSTPKSKRATPATKAPTAKNTARSSARRATSAKKATAAKKSTSNGSQSKKSE